MRQYTEKEFEEILGVMQMLRGNTNPVKGHRDQGKVTKGWVELRARLLQEREYALEGCP